MLTKSKYMSGLQCLRLLWHSNQKLLPERTIIDEDKEYQGAQVEEQVKRLYPNAVNLGNITFKENLEKTETAVKEKKIIFEAGFQKDNLYARSDLIIPIGNKWDLVEIKSTNEVEKHHIPDLAFQKYVLEKCGLKINNCFVFHLNKEYVKEGDIDPNLLIIQEDVTDLVESVLDVENNSLIFLKVLEQKTAPNMCISKNCNKPYECPLKKDCWGTLPDKNVLQLKNWRVYWDLFEKGIEDIKDLPDDTPLNKKEEIIVEAVENNKIIIDKEKIKEFLESLHFPLYHFDFETFDTAVPIFDKSRPYQKIPFQYSLHIEQKGGSIEHREFLADGTEDPRPALLKQMKEDLKGTGDIIVFNKHFEINVMQKLAEDFPEHSEWLNKAIERIVDLADIFKNYHYYNPDQNGSYSIKVVLPAVTGKSYDDLDIGNGMYASLLYFYSHFKDKGDKEKIRKDLLKYCGLDTEGMVYIIKELRGVVNG